MKQSGIEFCLRELFEDSTPIIYVNGNYKGDDEIGHSNNIYYKALAQGVRHFKETEEGRETMCELVQKYAEEYAEKYGDEREKKGEKRGALSAKTVLVRNLMENMKLTLKQALNALGIQGEERTAILKQLQK